jgi:hypothetical protein
VKVNPILIFGLGSQGQAFAQAFKTAFDAAFVTTRELVDGLILDGDGVLRRVRPGVREPVQFCPGLRDRLEPGVFSANRLSFLRSVRERLPVLDEELLELFSSASKTEVLSSYEFDAVPTVLVVAPAADPVGSSVLFPFLSALHDHILKRLRQAAITRHLLVLLPELFPETQVSPLADARCYEFFRELEYLHERPAVVTGAPQCPVSFSWVLGRRTETGYDLADMQEVARYSAEFFTYLAWKLINLEHGEAVLNEIEQGKRCSYSSFGCARLVYPTDNVRVASTGRAECELLERLFPDIAAPGDLRFNKTELFIKVKDFIKDLGIDGLPLQFGVAPDGSTISVPLEMETGRSFEAPAEGFISSFQNALVSASTTGFSEAERAMAATGDVVFQKLRERVVQACKSFMGDAARGAKYAVSFLSALLQKTEVPFTREELPQETLTLADIQEELRAEFDKAFGVKPETRKRRISLKRSLEEKDGLLRGVKERLAQAGKSGSIEAQQEIERKIKVLSAEKEGLEKEYRELSDAVFSANLSIDDPSKRKSVLDGALKEKMDAVEQAQDWLRKAHDEYLRAKKECSTARRMTIAAWVSLVVVSAVALVVCAFLARYRFLADYLAHAWPFLIALFALDLAFGTFRGQRRANAVRRQKGKDKVASMDRLVEAGRGYLDEKLRYATVSESLGIIGELSMDVDLKFISSIYALMKFVQERWRTAYEDLGAIREQDTHLERYIVGRKDLEDYFTSMKERLDVEYAGFKADYLASKVWDDIVADREPSWPGDVAAFSQRVFAGLLGTSIQDLLRQSDLVSAEMFRHKFGRFHRSISAFLGITQPVPHSAATWRFIGLKETDDPRIREILAGEGGEPPYMFPSQDDKAILGYVVRMGLPAFSVAGNLSGLRSSSQFTILQTAAIPRLQRAPLYPPGALPEETGDRWFYLWVLCRALRPAVGAVEPAAAEPEAPESEMARSAAEVQAAGRAVSLPFQEFRDVFVDDAQSCALLEASVDRELQAEDAYDRLCAFLSGQLDKREEAVIHRVLEAMDVEPERKTTWRAVLAQVHTEV